MIRIASIFWFTFLLASVAIADQSYVYEISLRYNEKDVQTVKVDVLDGHVQQASLEDNLQVELSRSVSAGGNGGSTLVQLMRSSNLQVLHTARQYDLGVDIRRIAYVVCDDRVIFMSPTPKDLPTCETSR